MKSIKYFMLTIGFIFAALLIGKAVYADVQDYYPECNFKVFDNTRNCMDWYGDYSVDGQTIGTAAPTNTNTNTPNVTPDTPNVTPDTPNVTPDTPSVTPDQPNNEPNDPPCNGGHKGKGKHKGHDKHHNHGKHKGHDKHGKRGHGYGDKNHNHQHQGNRGQHKGWK